MLEGLPVLDALGGQRSRWHYLLCPLPVSRSGTGRRLPNRAYLYSQPAPLPAPAADELNEKEGDPGGGSAELQELVQAEAASGQELAVAAWERV